MVVTAFLAVAAIAASLIQMAVGSSASSSAEALSRKQGEEAEAYRQKQFELQEKQRKEGEKARKKEALQRALRIPGSVEPKQLPGLAPLKRLTDPSIARKQNISNIFGGVGSALGAASNVDFGGLSSTRGVTPGVSVNYNPTAINPYA